MITQGGLSSKDGEKYGVGILPAFFLFFSISFVFVTVLALCRLFRFFYFFFEFFCSLMDVERVSTKEKERGA